MKEDWKAKRKAELELEIPDGYYQISAGDMVVGTGKGGYIMYLLALEESVMNLTNEGMETMTDDGMFRDLTRNETLEFQQWARENYEVGSPINRVWHPVVQAECKVMNTENHRESDDVYFNEE
jgi:hypothetical protein